MTDEEAQTKIRELQAQIGDLELDANAYRLVRDHVVAQLIGDNWDGDASEESIVIEWAEHVAAFHPAELCLGRGCDHKPVDDVLQMVKLRRWVEAHLRYADMHEERSAVDVIIDLMEAVRQAMPAILQYFQAIMSGLVRDLRAAGADIPDVKIQPYTGPRSAKEAMPLPNVVPRT